MQSISNLPAPTSDLRSSSKEYRRDRIHYAKWNHTGLQPRPAFGKPCAHISDDAPLLMANEACIECAVRPQHRDMSRRIGRHAQGKKVHAEHKNTVAKATCARKAFRSEIAAAGDFALPGSSDYSSSGEEEVQGGTVAPVPDAEIMYSYDAMRGPGRGNDILGYAVTQAVQRYENKQVEKLAKEYEFVDSVHDNGYAGDADEDDFEIVDYEHLD